MKVTGFTFIRNGLKYDYPFVEAIKSILPLCDEIIVAVGKSDDDTRNTVTSLGNKIKIIDTVWDDSLRKGGKVLAFETNKAFAEVSLDSDWAFYIQGDEVLHEKYIPEIKAKMLKFKDDKSIDGLLFDYKHFYGSYDYLGASNNWYRKEIRITRSSKNIYSYRDAQGFRKNNNKKLRVKPINACIHHYGWVKEPKAMQGKQEIFHKLWHDEKWMEKNVAKVEEFDYSKVDALVKFKDSHPHVMNERVKRLNWTFDYDVTQNKFSLKDRLKNLVKSITGLRIGEYKNYIEI